MKYMVMMFGDAAEMRETRSTEWIREMITYMVQVDVDLRAAGELVSAEGLADPSEATTVTYVDGAGASPISTPRTSTTCSWPRGTTSPATGSSSSSSGGGRPPGRWRRSRGPGPCPATSGPGC